MNVVASLSFIALIAALICAGPGETDIVTLYIATNGNDAWSGRRAGADEDKGDGPFATFQRAREEIRAIKQRGTIPAGGIRVLVRGGKYRVAETFRLTSQDAGTASAPIVYESYENESVHLTGGKEVAGFIPVADEDILRRFDPACRGKILQADLRAQGIADFGEMSHRGFGTTRRPAGLELFFKGRPMALARWPNEGWATIAGVAKTPNTFSYDGDRPNRWLNATDVWLHGYWAHDWADAYVKVKAIHPRSREIEMAEEPYEYNKDLLYAAGQRYRALNVPEELDEPGEWYLDRTAGVLYFWPPEPIGDGDVCVSMSNAPLILLETSFVAIRGFVLEATRGTAVTIKGGERNLVSGCIFRDIGGKAVVIEGGSGHGVESCDISETGDGGIAMNGGERATLTPGNHFAVNNHIYRYSRWVRTYSAAVTVSGVGNRVAHNRIHDAPHVGIHLAGNDHVVEFNELHHLCGETADVGAFYMGRNWTMRGNVVRYNYFHDIEGFMGGNDRNCGAQAVYLDDAACGTTVYGNIFSHVRTAVLLGGGRDNTIENNIFVESPTAVHFDARGLTWAKNHMAPGGDWKMEEKLREVRHDQPPYSVRYPKLAEILNDEPLSPRGNTIARNIIMGKEWLRLVSGGKAELLAIRDNLIAKDPQFVDPARADFRLKANSPAYKMGFKPIPVEKIGPSLEKRGESPPSR